MSETVEYRGYKINIHQDEWNDENPREWCNLGTLALNNNFWAEENISSTDELYENLLEHEEIRPWIAQDQDYCGYSIDHDKAQKNLEKNTYCCQYIDTNMGMFAIIQAAFLALGIVE